MNEFLCDIESELDDSDDERKIFLGDININWNENSYGTNEYKDLLDSFNATLTNHQITRPKSNALIDHVITQGVAWAMLSDTIELPGFSDHNAIISSFDVGKTCDKRERKITKNYIDHKKLERNFKLDVLKLFQSRNPNEKLACINQAINFALESACTVKTFKLRHPSVLDRWYSVKVLELMKKKDNLCSSLRKRRRKNLPFDNLKRKIKELDLELQTAITNSCKQYFHNVIKNGDTKKLWNDINERIGVKHKVKKIILQKQDETLTDELDVSSALNNHFINVAERSIPLASVSSENLNRFNTIKSVQNSLVLEATTCDEVFSVIRGLDKNKAVGSDNVSVSILQTLNFHLCVYLSDLINCMYESGIYPDALKEGLVVAIPKCTKATEEDDYRPVTILKCLNKPIEIVLHRRLETYFDKIDVLDPNQFGFVKNSSTEPPVMELLHHAFEALNRGKKLGVVFLDLRKAFDSMPHSTLIDKMESYGVRGSALNLIESYFSNRSQAVKIGNVKSSFMKVIRGIAQGSNIGPLLFNIYLNDFMNLKLKANKTVRFADDTIVIYEFEDAKEFTENVQHDMAIAVKYFEDNGMSLNVNKSNFIIFHSKKTPNLPNKISMNDGNSLIRVTTSKYLGVEFDEHLTFKNHLEKLSKSLISTVNLLGKLKWHLPTSILKSIYFAHFHSHLCYIPFVWSFCAEKFVKPIQTLQNRALKHVFHLPVLYHTENLYTGPAKSILPVKGIALMMTLNFIHKVLKNNIHTNLKFSIVHSRTRQNNSIANSKTPKNTFGSRDLLSIAPRIYNTLPEVVRFSRSINEFKFKLKLLLRNCNVQFLNTSQFSLLNTKFN